MHEWAATAPAHWGIDPDAMLGEPTGGRLPMAGSIHPKSGPTWIVIGDAAGSINPFNGEGIDYAYETGRMAAELIDEALDDRLGDAAGALPRPPRGGVRPLLPGGPGVRARHRPARR